MKKKIIIFSVCLLLLSSLFFIDFKKDDELMIKEEETLAQEPKQVDLNKYHKNLDLIANSNHVKGMQVVAFKGEEILDAYNYGYSDFDDSVKVNDDTVFRIASTSKMISNMLIMKLVDEGKLSLDSNLKELTGLNFNEDVKLYQVLTHTSGIIDTSLFNNNMEKVLDINHILDVASVNKPGEVYVYSNFNAGTMAAIIEKVTDEYFMDYAQRELFDYLDLNAAYVCEYLDKNSKVAKMYSDGEILDPLTWEYNYDFYRSFELGKQYRLAYGNMFISAKDLAKLGMVLAGNGTYNDKNVLSYEALCQTRTVRNEALGYKYLTGLNTDFFDDYVEGRFMYGHTGSAYNALSILIFDPSDSTGVAFVSNYARSQKNELGYNSLLYDVVNLAYKEVIDEN